MAYVKRVSDDRVFEVFGAESHQVLRGREVVSMPYFFIFDSEATEDDEGNLCDGLWCWRPCVDFLPLEELVPDDEDIEEDIDTPEQEDIREDRL